MTRKQQRSAFIITGLVILGIAAALVLTALRDTIVFFYTPSEVIAKKVEPGVRIRLGGLVAKDSIERLQGSMVRFTVTDTDKSMVVSYGGALPDLFREGQGVVTEGKLLRTGIFEADTVLAKHDENYMPKEVADALKEKGVWKEGGKASQ